MYANMLTFFVAASYTIAFTVSIDWSVRSHFQAHLKRSVDASGA